MINKPAGERVRKSTSASQNEKIDNLILENIGKYSMTPALIGIRIKELDKEWDIERVLEINMATIALFGIIMTIFVNIYWIILPSVVLLFFMQHALQGWCPPIPIFRHFKVRTRPEIDREKYALKAIRGDFSNLSAVGESMALEALQAAEKI